MQISPVFQLHIKARRQSAMVEHDADSASDSGVSGDWEQLGSPRTGEAELHEDGSGSKKGGKSACGRPHYMLDSLDKLTFSTTPAYRSLARLAGTFVAPRHSSESIRGPISRRMPLLSRRSMHRCVLALHLRVPPPVILTLCMSRLSPLHDHHVRHHNRLSRHGHSVRTPMIYSSW